MFARKAANTGTRLGSSLLLPAYRRPLGFQKREYGLEWYPNRAALHESHAGPVLVGASYEFEAPARPAAAGAELRKVLKYSSFENHWDYWRCVESHLREGLPQNLHEVFPAQAPRCLYFDLDGSPDLKTSHAQITSWLQCYVRWFFGGDRRGWEAGSPEPVVLTSANPTKYSCHVVFPQIQFSNYSHQAEYLPVLLSGLPALEVDLVGGISVPILDRVVDRVPYSRFQTLRGPYACKLVGGQLLRETRLEPESLFRSDPLAAFAGLADSDYALELPPVELLLQENEELRHFYERQLSGMASSASSFGPGWLYGSARVSPMDQANLYLSDFQRRGGGVIDLAGLTEVEQFEEALRWLHPDRASQYWSWFRISGVVCRMLEEHCDEEEHRRRIWEAFFAWSNGYPLFDVEENIEMVEKARGRCVSGLQLLLRLAQFDNPDMQLRTRRMSHTVHVRRPAAGPQPIVIAASGPGLSGLGDAM